MTRRLLAVLVTLPLLAACGADTASPAPPTPDDSAAPSGDYVSDGLPDPFGEGDSLRVTFREGEVSFQATCNTMSGTAEVEDDVLVVDHVGGTEMGCPGAGFEQDDWLVDFFTSSPAIALLDDGFELTHDGTTVRFLSPEAAPDDDVRLGSVVWQLTGIEQTDGDSVSMTSVQKDTVATLDITGTRFRMETGCNSASATVYVDEDSVAFDEILITERGCPAGSATEQERLQLSVLDDGLTWSVDGDQLRLSRGPTTLLYEAGR